MKHALGHKGAAQSHAIGAAGQSPLAPSLHAVRRARSVKRAIDLDEALVDPRAFGSIGAAAHHSLEVRVDADLEAAATNGAGEGARDVKAVEGNDGAWVGPEPEHLARLLVRHGKDPVTVGELHPFRGEGEPAPRHDGLA